MQINNVVIEDTFAEAFPMWASCLLVTADAPHLASLAAETAAGLSTSIIGCGSECGVGRELSPAETPDGRPGRELLVFSPSREKLAEQLFIRIGQAILPTATSACYNGLASDETCPVGGKLRYFGDGYQSSKLLDARRFWRIPVSDGEFVVEETFGLVQGVGGGNLLLIGSRSAALQAAFATAGAIRQVQGVIAPFPGGVCRSPSKVGSKYKNVRASTNQIYSPTLRSRVESALPLEAEAAYEIVIDGLSAQAVCTAMQRGILTACEYDLLKVTAGNYGGKLGPYHFHLHALLSGLTPCS